MLYFEQTSDRGALAWQSHLINARLHIVVSVSLHALNACALHHRNMSPDGIHFTEDAVFQHLVNQVTAEDRVAAAREKIKQ